MRTITNLALFDRDKPLDQKFSEFHRENPDVYAELVRLARTTSFTLSSWRATA